MTDDPEKENTPSKSGQKKGRLLIRIFLVSLWSLFLGFIFIEVFLRFIPLPGLGPEDLKPDYLTNESIHRTIPHPYLSYCLKPGWKSGGDKKNTPSKTHNKHGLRGPHISLKKPKGAFRIACLGGSSTYGNTPSSDAATWPARLEHHLSKAKPNKKIQVLNGGAPGWSSFESTINLSFRMLEFKPDLIIIYHAVNDMRCALYKNPPKMDNAHWRAPWPVFRPSPMESVLEKSICYLIFRRYCTTYFEERADINFVAIVNPPPPKTDWYVQTAEKTSPRGFISFRRNLTNIIAIARSHGIKVVMATQAFDFSDIKDRKSGPNQKKAMGTMNNIIRDLAAKKKVCLVNAQGVLEGEAEKQLREKGKENIFTWEVHLTDQGADLLARTFAQRILKENFIPD